MRWKSGSGRLELVARDPQRLISLDIVSGTISETPVATDARVRLFPGGAEGLLTESRPTAPTAVLDRATNRKLLSFTSVMDIVEIGRNVLIRTGTALHEADPVTGALQWSWEDPGLRITAFTVDAHIVYVTGVRAGHSVIIELSEGVPRAENEVVHEGSPAVALDIAADGDGVHVLVESPVIPPRAVAVENIVEPAPHRPPERSEDRSIGDTVWHEFPADDGTLLTVALTSPPDMEGPAPLILTCYGGFGVAYLPIFEPTIPAWISCGGRYGFAQIRGGGEHGTAWREAGRGHNKYRGINDLAAIARGLVDIGVTQPELLVLVGASHGGVIVTSCALGHPEICAGVVATAAPLDLLSLTAHPLGRSWMSEFCGPENAESIKAMRRISPLYRAQSIPAGSRLPKFLGIVLAEDGRVNADATQEFVSVLRAKGGEATLWQAQNTGHGNNHLDSLHQLGMAVLGFAATTTGVFAAPPLKRKPS
ncbi:prolyl oligopeptidase family serine peptidase [Nesterenkonia sp. AN1]|uniref:prolyl oligopeptidase family serine peptidase n=1 Tax=Nesterenkonia sp. AN1 TaxID=652017 RepID=UPI00190F934A|nr:prolyl oligopeptidase family serine peptidase [Nesterenkonia sp. AN1]